MLFYFRDKGPALAYVAVCNDAIKPTPFSVVNEEPVGLVSAPVASGSLGNQAPFHQTSQGGGYKLLRSKSQTTLIHRKGTDLVLPPASVPRGYNAQALANLKMCQAGGSCSAWSRNAAHHRATGKLEHLFIELSHKTEEILFTCLMLSFKLWTI